MFIIERFVWGVFQHQQPILHILDTSWEFKNSIIILTPGVNAEPTG